MRKKMVWLTVIASIAVAAIMVLGAVPVSKAGTKADIAPEMPVAHQATGWVPPHLDPYKNVTKREIWLKGSGMTPENTTVTLTVKGDGEPIPAQYLPADVTLVMQTSDSMNDSFHGMSKLQYAKDAALDYISHFNWTGGDRCAVVSFSTNNSSEPVINLVEPFVNDSNLITTAINGLNTSGNGTPLYDATVFAVNYTNHNHYPPNQTHPHEHSYGHHQPVVILFTDGNSSCDLDYNLTSCLDFVTDSYNPPPPPNFWGYGTIVFTIGLGDQLNQSVLEAIAQAGGGTYYYAPSPSDMNEIYLNTTNTIPSDPYVFSNIVPIPNPQLILDVLPPYIRMDKWWPTANNTVMIRSFYANNGKNGTFEIGWDIRSMKINDVFEIQYNISSTLAGWQSIGVTEYNASNEYGSNYCRAKYQNYQYWKTLDPADIWTNETPDVSIFVKEPPTPEFRLVLVPLCFVAAIAIIIKWRKKD